MCNYIYVSCATGNLVMVMVMTRIIRKRVRQGIVTNNYTQKELSCQHHYHLVESWCPKYIETERRCPPTIVSKQYW